MKIKKRYDPVDDVKFEQKGQTSLVDPSFEKETDINEIISRYTKTGQLTHINPNPIEFGDVSYFGDYKQSMDTVLAAQDAFASLPSKIRDRFKNDPQEFLTFMGDSANSEEAIKLGLATARPQDPLPTPAVAPKSTNDAQTTNNTQVPSAPKA